MKNVIYTYYNMLITEINKSNKNYYFYYNGILYLFYLVENDLETIKYIYNYLITNNIETYKIILNKANELFTLVDNKKYSLLEIKGILKYEVKFEEFKYYQIDREGHNWEKLWSDRLDYYEIQLRELGYNYQTVLNSFGFYECLAENAILYYNLTINKFKEDKIIGIVHNRMNYPCYQIEYNNPLNFVIDYNVRDIAEYIKSYSINDNFEMENVILLIEKLNLNNLMFNLLYSRLLYPTFYFDKFDNIILEDGQDNEVLPLIEKTDNYILMLKEIYKIYNTKHQMFNIEWLNKNVEN